MATAEILRPGGPQSAVTPTRDRLSSDIDGRVVVSQAPASDMGPTQPTPKPARSRLPVGWQIGLAVAGWPLWWAIGISQFIFPILAAPLAWQLYRRGHVRVPPGFWIWGMFLLWVVVSAAALDVTVEGALPPTGTGRYLAFTARLLNYLSLTVMMLYVGNLSELELPRRRVISWLTALGLAAIMLGTLAVVFPDFGFRTAVSYLLPSALLEDAGDRAALAQVQPVLGDPSPRPAAPFPFTNAWGNSLSLLLIWLVVGWLVLGGPGRRLAAGLSLAVAVVPIVYSLNRGVWLGIGIGLAVVAVRLARRGKWAALAALGGVLAAGLMVLAVSPLGALVQQRAETGHSNEVRGSLAADAVSSAFDSPIIGYGSTRAAIGSDASIAIGATEDCPRCGNRDIGSTGQLWLVLIAQGIIGAVLYVGFFVRTLWAHRSDLSPLGIAGTLVVLLELFYALFYSALTMPLAVTLLSVGLLWRNRQVRQVGRVVVPHTSRSSPAPSGFRA